MVKKLFYLLPVLGLVMSSFSSEEPASKDPVAYEAGNVLCPTQVVAIINPTAAL